MIKNIKNFNLRTIANSGQCFRINEIDENIFNLQCTNKFLRVKKIADNKYDFDCTESEYKFYEHYFDLKTNYDKYKNVCKDNDTFLKKCIKYSDGLRILNQDKFEMVISFIISQRKSVKAIMTSIERLSKVAGKKITNKYGAFYTFPTAKQILNVGKSKLASCGLGYRLDYIMEFCKDFDKVIYDLEKFNDLDDENLINELLKIRGVGIKVASCIALFAYHRIGICPKDVWIGRVLDKKYGGKVPKSYEKYAGIIQQYWFNYTRINGI